jgi:large subunit ribosomal protein L10
VLRAEKARIVDDLRGIFNDAGVIVVTHYMGLNVAELQELRVQMRGAGARFRVTKNRLAKLAIVDTDFAPISDMLTGPTAIAYSDDPVAAPKVISAFAKKNEKLKILGGSYSGALLDAEQVRTLAEMPSLDELRAKLLSLINTPATRLAMVLQAPAGQMARVLKAKAELG